MDRLIQCTCILVCLKFSSPFKVDISACTTVNGLPGFCRQLEDCFGDYNNLSPVTCNGGRICCPKRKVSEQMCIKYARSVFRRSNFVNLDSDVNDVKQDECYIKGTPLIVGGERAGHREFPHMAALGFGSDINNVRWMCGGSLISERFIVSAAHCIEDGEFGKPNFVELGVTDLKNNNNPILTVEDIIVHPRYDPKNKHNDIALLKLSRDVRLSSSIRPVCLDFSGRIRESTALATGFGKLDDSDIEGSPLLMKVQLDIIRKEDCFIAFKRAYPNGLTDSKLCAGVLDGGKDTCQGDSGGPLMTLKKRPYCTYNLVGVTSFGRGCGYQMSPAIYTRVFSFIPWIESIVWPNRN